MQEREPPGWPLCALVTISKIDLRQDLAKMERRFSCSGVRASPNFG